MVAAFQEILLELSAILANHCHFSRALNDECTSNDAESYSLAQTWSAIQVEVQQLLDLHLTYQARPTEKGKGGNETYGDRCFRDVIMNVLAGIDSGHSSSLEDEIVTSKGIMSVKFTFDDIMENTTKATRKEIYMDELQDRVTEDRKPLVEPSPYYMFAVGLGLKILFTDFAR